MITIPNLTGLSRGRAVGLVDNLGLTIRVEKIGVSEIDSATPSPGIVAAGPFARDVVVNQDPLPDTRVKQGATQTLFVPVDRALRPGERKFRLLTHCGLSYPLEFDDRFWLPVDRKFRRTINAPEGFYSEWLLRPRHDSPHRPGNAHLHLINRDGGWVRTNQQATGRV